MAITQILKTDNSRKKSDRKNKHGGDSEHKILQKKKEKEKRAIHVFYLR